MSTATKTTQAGKPLSVLDYTMLALVAAGLLIGGVIVSKGHTLTAFLVASVFILAAALIGELTGGE